MALALVVPDDVVHQPYPSVRDIPFGFDLVRVLSQNPFSGLLLRAGLLHLHPEPGIRLFAASLTASPLRFANRCGAANALLLSAHEGPR